MNTHQTIALWVVLATGCSASRSLVCTQAIAQLQTDVVLPFKPDSTACNKGELKTKQRPV